MECGIIYTCDMEYYALRRVSIIFGRYVALTLTITILQVLVGVVIILMVLFQSGKNQGLGVIGGAADTFLAKSKAKSLDAKLARATKWVGAVFIVLTLALNVLSVAGV